MGEGVLVDFTCPKDGGALRELRCEVCGHQYKTVAGQPVLIDFERSILDEAAFWSTGGGSYKPNREDTEGKTRGRALLLAVRGFFWGASVHPLTARFADMMGPDDLVLIVGGAQFGEGMGRIKSRTLSFDVYHSDRTDFVADGHSIPLPDASVDGVWVQAVLEHVLEPERVVAEIHRVLKPNGVVYADTPFMQGVHEGAYDFTRYSHSGHRWLFRNFEEISSGVSVGPGRAAVLALRHAFAALFRSRKAGSLCALLFFWLRFIDTIAPERYQRDSAGGVCFIGRKANGTLRLHQIVDYYRT
jgi:SAM-dependent methyltransferase